MAMRLGISCYVFPKVRSRLCFQRPFFRFSVDRHAHSLRYSLPTSTSSGRLRCLTSSRRRKFAVSALPNVDQEADDFEDVFEPRRSQGRNGADVHSDAGDIGTSGRTGSQGSRGRRSSGRGGYQRPSWMQGWDDGQTVGTRDSDLKYGSQGDNWDGDHRSRIVDRSHTSRADDWKRSDFGSDKSSSDARRDAFARFLRRDTGPETEKISSPEWDRETGFYPEDSRTGRTTPKSNSAWARLSKKLSDVPTQDTGEWSDWVGGKNQLSTSPSSPDDLSPTQDKSVGPLPPLSKFFPDSIINPFSNPPPIKSRGFFSQIESDKELAATGRKLGEDLWGKANELRSSSYGADRFASKSVGSRSVPSKPSIPGRHSKYTAKQSRGNRQLFSTSAPVVENSYVTAPSESESPSEETTPGAAVDYRQNEEASSSSVSTNSTYQGKYSDGSVGSEEPDGNVPGSSSYSVSNDSLEDQSANPLEEPSVNRVSSLIVPPSLAPRPSSVSGAVIETFPSPIPTSLPFEFQYSYSEVPKAIPLKLRNKFSPFGPQTMDRPWTGKAPLKKSKKKLPEFDSFKPPPANKKGVKYVQQPGPFPAGQGPKPAKSREEILGEPLTKEEIAELVQSCIKEQRQLNLGRDGLTHNMLDLIHSHWKRRRCLKIKCKGVPTVDMDNLCFHLEDKTGGVIIQRSGGTIYLYRGRYYNYKDRPQIPLMLWKPLAPCYPKLVKAVPDGMTKEEVNELRRRGRKMEPLKKLNKNGVYLTLVQDIRDGFLFDDLVKLDCKGLNPSDYKKIGAKLKDMVPCVLLSFEKEQILVWKGRNLEEAESIKHPVADCGAESDEDEDDADNGSLESEHEISVDEAMDKVLDDETAGGAAWDEDFSVLKPTDHSVVGSVNGAQARGSEPSSYGSASGLQPGAGSEVRMMEYPSDLVKPENQEIQEILPLYIAERTSLEDPLLRAEQLGPPEFANNCSPSYQEPRPVPGVLVADKSLPQAWPGNDGEQECTPLSDAVSKPEGEISVRQKQRERRKPRSHLDDLWNQAIESGEAVALDEPEAVDPDVLKETVKSLRSLEREQESSTVHREVPDSNDKVQVRRKVKSDDLGITATMQRGLPVDELAKFLNRNLT